MKTFLKILAWLGLLIIISSLLLSYSSSWVMASRPGQMGSGVGYFVVMCVGAIGALLALFGGFSARPKHFWIGSIVVGVAYIASFYGYIFGFELYMLGGVLLGLLPGLACIAAGIILRKLNKRA